VASWSSWSARWPCWSPSSGAWSPPGRHRRRRPPRCCEPGWLGGHLARTALALGCFALAVAATPRAGVQLQELPELGTVDGVADIGFALAAWFTDPHHNWIGLLQFKEPVR